MHPKPLFYQFEAERDGQSRWEDLVTGPDDWQVRITQI